jgi:hypothetical protein
MIPIHKIKHMITSLHNKIWNNMNISNIIIYLSKLFIKFYPFEKIRAL